jgi:hypothetical protein
MQLNMNAVNYYKNVHTITEQFPREILDVIWNYKVGIEIWEELKESHYSGEEYLESDYSEEGDLVLGQLYCYKIDAMMASIGLPFKGRRFVRATMCDPRYFHVDVSGLLTGNPVSDYKIMKGCFLNFIELFQRESILRKSPYLLEMSEWLLEGSAWDTTNLEWLDSRNHRDWRKRAIVDSILEAEVFPKTK